MDFVVHTYTLYLRRVIKHPSILFPAIRGLATWCVLLALLPSIFSKAIVIADFYVNQDYIAKNLCLNRKSTAISCAGKCQLNRRLKQENKDNGYPERRADNRNETISAPSFPTHGNERYYVETSTGRLARRVTDVSGLEEYSFAFFHKHEFMGWGGRGLKDFSTVFWALAQIAMVVIGLILYFKHRQSSLTKPSNAVKKITTT